MATATEPVSTVERLQEYCDNRGRELKIDEENGILYDVKIVGLRSTNYGERAADYPQPVLAKAVHLYESKTSYLGHAPLGKNPQFRDQLGVHKNVHAKDDGLYADFHFNPKGSHASDLVWTARNNPQGLSFSHDVKARVIPQNGRKVAQEIVEVLSIDAVTRGGTTVGLYEEEQSQVDSDPDLKQLAEHGLSAMDTVRSILFTERMPIEEKKSRLREALDGWQLELAVDTEKEITAIPEKETIPMAIEMKDITIEQLREQRADLVAVLTGTDEASTLKAEVTRLTEEATASKSEIARLTEEKNAVAADAEKATKTLAIQEELKAVKFPIDNAIAYSQRFQEQLWSAADSDARKLLMDDRMILVNTASSPKRAGGVPPMAPVSGGAKPNALRDRFKL